MFHSVAQAALKFSLRVLYVLESQHADICELTGSFPRIYRGISTMFSPVLYEWTLGRGSSHCGFETTNKTVNAFTKGEVCVVWLALCHPL